MGEDRLPVGERRAVFVTGVREAVGAAEQFLDSVTSRC